MKVLDGSITDIISMRIIKPSKFLVRYEDSKMSVDFENLKSSIREIGLINSITVRPIEEGFFEIIAGHRRFNACKSLRHQSISCQILDLSDKSAYEMQLTENIQRKSMDPVEEAESFQKYIVSFDWGDINDLAVKIGKSTEYIYHRMQLLKLPPEIKQDISCGKLSTSKALEIISIDPDIKREFVNEIVANNMTVKQIRTLKNNMTKKPNYKKDKKSNELNIIKRSEIILKISLVKVDELINDSKKIPPSKRLKLDKHLLDLRGKIHSMIDDNIQYKKQHTK